MLAEATPRARPGLTFELGDIGRWTSDPAHDLVIANASLQWVPDHAEVLARWAAGAGARWSAGRAGADERRSSDAHWLAAEVAHERAVRVRLSRRRPRRPGGGERAAPGGVRGAAARSRLRPPARAPAGLRARAADHVVGGRVGVAVRRSPASGGRCRPSGTRSSSASTAIACSPSSVTMRRTSSRSSGS